MLNNYDSVWIGERSDLFGSLKGVRLTHILVIFSDPITVPMFTYISSDKIVNERDTVTLHCEATGVPQPEYGFYHYEFFIK